MASAEVSVQRLLPAAEAGELRLRRTVPAETAGPEARARGVGQVLDLAVELYLRRFGVYVSFVALFLLPIHLAAELLLLVPPTDGAFLIASGQGLLAFFLVLWGIARVFVVTLAAGDLLGRPGTIAAALRETLVRLPGLVFLLVLIGLVQAAGLLACIVPVVFVLWLFEPALPVFALEGDLPGPEGRRRRDVLGFSDAFEAVRRAPRIARGGSTLLRWGACTLLSLVFAAPFLLQFQGFQAELGFRDALEAQLPPAAAALVLAGASAFLQAIGLGFRSVVVCVFYFDQRFRKEALGLQLALERRRALHARRTAR